MKHKLAVFFVGIPCAGKSTQRQAIGAPYVSMDEIRQELTGSLADQSRNGEVAGIAFQRWDKLLSENDLVILDNTNYNKKNRKKFLEIAQKYDATCQAIIFPVSLAEAKERNSKREPVVPEHVIERMYNGYEMPTEEEGFHIITIFGQ